MPAAVPVVARDPAPLVMSGALPEATGMSPASVCCIIIGTTNAVGYRPELKARQILRLQDAVGLRGPDVH